MTTSLRFEDVAVGDEVTPLVLELTPTRVVAGAIATRDFMPVHHDRDYANSQGAPEIFMNILSDTAYCSRFLTDWAGPDAIVKHLAIRLGVPAFANSTLTLTGTVSWKTVVDGAGVVEIAFRAANDLGDHVTGTATLDVPRRDAR
jgi:acyl dehydratase